MSDNKKNAEIIKLIGRRLKDELTPAQPLPAELELHLEILKRTRKKEFVRR